MFGFIIYFESRKFFIELHKGNQVKTRVISDACKDLVLNMQQMLQEESTIFTDSRNFAKDSHKAIYDKSGESQKNSNKTPSEAFYHQDCSNETNNLACQIKYIGFMNGPGSFTSIRILTATCMGIAAAMPHIKIYPVTLHEIIELMPDYQNIPIVLENGLFYDNEKWQHSNNIPKFDKYITHVPNIGSGIKAFIEQNPEPRPLRPFYGVNPFPE